MNNELNLKEEMKLIGYNFLYFLMIIVLLLTALYGVGSLVWATMQVIPESYHDALFWGGVVVFAVVALKAFLHAEDYAAALRNKLRDKSINQIIIDSYDPRFKEEDDWGASEHRKEKQDHMKAMDFPHEYVKGHSQGYADGFNYCRKAGESTEPL